MTMVNLEYAQEHFRELIKKAAQGEPFVIEADGVALVQVARINAADAQPARRIGFLDGQIHVPDDFDDMCRDEIVEMCEGLN